MTRLLGLPHLAALLFAISDGGFLEEDIAEAINPWWSRTHAAQIGKSLAELLTSLRDPNRHQGRAEASLSIDEMIAKGEQILS